MEPKMKNMRIKSPEPTLLAARHLPPPTLIQAGPLSVSRPKDGPKLSPCSEASFAHSASRQLLGVWV